MTESTANIIVKLQQKANNGDAQAQFNLALRYINGTEIEKDQELALDWNTKAAENGYVGAQFALGVYYFLGVNDSQTEKLINKWLWRLASGKTTDHVLNLAVNLSVGSPDERFTKANANLAFIWFKKAVAQNHAEAQFWLGQCYQNGWGIEKDDLLAFECFKHSAELGYADSYYELALCYRDALGIAQDYQKAFYCMTKATKEADVNSEAYLFLGDLYANGQGTQKNYETAVKWFTKAVEKDVAGAQLRLNFCNWFGLGVEKYINLLSEWHEDSTTQDNDNTDYQYWASKKYLYGESVKQDCEMGMKWMVGAAFQGHIEANNWLNNAYLSLVFPSCALEKENAEQCYKIAVDYCTENLKGNKTAEAYLLLGILYSAGKGVLQNDEQAFECFKKAREACADYGEDVEDNELIDCFVRLFLASCYVQGKGTKQNIGKAVCGELHSVEEISYIFVEGMSVASRYAIKNNTMFLSLLKCKIFIACKEYVLAKDFITQSFQSTWRSMDVGFKDMCLINIDQEKELDIKNQQLEAKNQELNNIIAMFAHNFLGTLQCIRSNAEHQNNPSIHLKTVKMMGGTLTAFSILSADDNKLIEQLEQDKTGDVSLMRSLANNLALAVSQLLSKTNKDKITNLYMKHLRQSKQIKADTTSEELRTNRVLRKKWQELQHQWGDEFNALFSESVELSALQTWISDNLFPIQITGFDEHDIHFKEYGITDSIFLVVFMEIFVNALKYMDVTHDKPLKISLSEKEQCYILSCENPSLQETGKGTHKGTDFLKTIAKKINGDFKIELIGNSFKATFSIPTELLK